MDDESENPTLLDSLPLDIDISDETQDFRFLSLFASAKPGTDASIPKRGEKDFEPDGTSHQDSILHESRTAMYSALAADLQGTPTVVGTWHPERELASMREAKGTFLKTMGRQDREGTVWLLPEETIYLVERGTMQCFWENGVPMDLAGVYAACLQLAGGAERYAVYSYLRRAGYALRRAPEWEGVSSPSKGVFGWLWESGLFLSSFLKTFQDLNVRGSTPILKKGVYRSYADIYSRLEIIPRYVAPSPKLKQRFVPDPSKTEAPFRLCFHVWKPAGHFKKSAPRTPDFRIAVVDARTTTFPTLTQVSALFNSVPYDDPAEQAKKSNFQRFKEGSRNVVLAIFDSGITSFLRISDTEFGETKMYAQQAFRPQKGAGSRPQVQKKAGTEVEGKKEVKGKKGKKEEVVVEAVKAVVSAERAVAAEEQAAPEETPAVEETPIQEKTPVEQEVTQEDAPAQQEVEVVQEESAQAQVEETAEEEASEQEQEAVEEVIEKAAEEAVAEEATAEEEGEVVKEEATEQETVEEDVVEEEDVEEEAVEEETVEEATEEFVSEEAASEEPSDEEEPISEPTPTSSLAESVVAETDRGLSTPSPAPFTIALLGIPTPDSKPSTPAPTTPARVATPEPEPETFTIRNLGIPL